jgi:hypothetical protein
MAFYAGWALIWTLVLVLLTAIGFASVLTNSEVIFNVRDMVGEMEELRQYFEVQLRCYEMFIVGALRIRVSQCQKYRCADSSDRKWGLCRDDGYFEAAWSSAAREFPEADVSACHVRVGMRKTGATTYSMEPSS